MAITKMRHMKQSGHLRRGIQYILNPHKTEQLVNTGTANILHPESADSIIGDMMQTKRDWGKTGGRQGYHFMISFRPGEADIPAAMDIAQKFVDRYLSERFEVVWAVHNDKKHLHIHIVFNSVSYADGYKYRYNDGDWEREIQPLVNGLCREYGLSEIELAKAGEKTAGRKKSGTDYHTAEAHKEGFLTDYEAMRSDIDHAVSVSSDYAGMLSVLKQMGYQITRDGKYLSIKPDYRKRAVRTGQLGKGYGKEELMERLQENTQQLSGEARAVSQAVYSSYTGRATPEMRRRMAELYRAGKGNQVLSEMKNKTALRKYYAIRRELEYANRYGVTSSDQITQRKNEVELLKKQLLQERKRLYASDGDRSGELSEIREKLKALRQETDILTGLERDFFSGEGNAPEEKEVRENGRKRTETRQ